MTDQILFIQILIAVKISKEISFFNMTEHKLLLRFYNSKMLLKVGMKRNYSLFMINSSSF